MRRTVVVLALLAGAAPAEDEVVLPVARKGIAGAGEGLVVVVDAGGGVRVGENKVALTGLAETFGEAVRKEAPRGGVSQIPVLLRVDRDAPWVHVQWVMMLMAEAKLYRVEFAVTRAAGPAYTRAEAELLGAERAEEPEEARLLAPLPTDGIVGEENQGAWPEVKVSVQLLPRKEVAAEVGGVQVTKPTEIRYRLGERESADLAAVGQWLREARKACAGQQVRLVGEIKAGQKTPFKHVVAVLNELRAAGIDDVDFYGTAVPDAGLRKLPKLPYPVRNWPGG